VDNFLLPYWRGYEEIVLSVLLNKLYRRVVHRAESGGGGRRSPVCTPNALTVFLPHLRSFALREGPRQPTIK
jgi:hypothetical protein